MSKRTCTIPGCGKTVRAKGLCGAHYERKRRNGHTDLLFGGHAWNKNHHVDGGKRCTTCEEVKPLTEFYKNGKSWDGLASVCKVCDRAWHKEDWAANLEERRAGNRRKYVADRQARIEQANEAVHIRRRMLAEAKRDAGVTLTALREIHGDSCCYCGVTVDFVPMKRGEPYNPLRASIEHLVPVSKGGGHTWDNCRIACLACNLSKNNRSVSEFVNASEQSRADILDGA